MQRLGGDARAGAILMNAGSSEKGRAGWCSTLPLALRAGRASISWPRHRAGLSPERYPRTVAHASTASIRPRNLEAVSGLACHSVPQDSRARQLFSVPVP